jgi:hypothetical protein
MNSQGNLLYMKMGSSQMSRHVLANHHFATGYHLTHVQSFTIIFRAMSRNHHRNQGLDKTRCSRDLDLGARKTAAFALIEDSYHPISRHLNFAWPYTYDVPSGNQTMAESPQ